jgi:hypothetical protein
LLLQSSCATVIRRQLLAVELTVDLDHEPGLGAVEVDHIGSDWHLTAELRPDLASSDLPPQHPLRQSHVAAQLAGTIEHHHHSRSLAAMAQRCR